MKRMYESRDCFLAFLLAMSTHDVRILACKTTDTEDHREVPTRAVAFGSLTGSL
jgi:hypothetical protein